MTTLAEPLPDINVNVNLDNDKDNDKWTGTCMAPNDSQPKHECVARTVLEESWNKNPHPPSSFGKLSHSQPPSSILDATNGNNVAMPAEGRRVQPQPQATLPLLPRCKALHLRVAPSAPMMPCISSEQLAPSAPLDKSCGASFIEPSLLSSSFGWDPPRLRSSRLRLEDVPRTTIATGHLDWISCCWIHPAQSDCTVVSGSHHRTLKVWRQDGDVGPQLHRTGHANESSTDESHTHHHSPHCTLPGHANGVSSCAVFPIRHRRILVSTGFDTDLHLWDLDTGARLYTVPHAHEDWIRCCCCCAVQKQDHLMVTGSDNGTLHVWRLCLHSTAVFLKRIQTLVNDSAGGGGVTCCSFSSPAIRTNVYLVSGNRDGTLDVWHQSSPYVLAPKESHFVHGQKLVGHDGPVTCCAVHLDSMVVVSGGHDRTLRLWKLDRDCSSPVSTSIVMARLPEHVVSCNFVDGSTILASSSPYAIQLWDIGSVPTTLLQSIPQATMLTCCATGGPWLVSGHVDQRLRVWKLQEQCRDHDDASENN